MDKRKYNYWHIITAVSKEYQKDNPEIKIGLVITHNYPKRNEGVCIINWKTGKEYKSAYVLGYLGRLLKTAEQKEVFDKTEEWIKEKGYQKYLDMLIQSEAEKIGEKNG